MCRAAVPHVEAHRRTLAPPHTAPAPTHTWPPAPRCCAGPHSLCRLCTPLPDLAPTPADKRTLGAADMAALWVSLVVSTTTLMLAGSLVDMGMSWQQVSQVGGWQAGRQAGRGRGPWEAQG